MNYFAHGRNFIDDPHFLAGTALPDWLSVVDRRVRARARVAAVWVDDPDPRLAALSRGIVQHHHDDRWFHQTRAFAELSLDFSQAIRRYLPDDDGFRPSFLGHILVELLLDSVLIEQDPPRLDDYYRAMDSLDPVDVGRAVGRVTTRLAANALAVNGPVVDGAVPDLAQMIRLFCSERFLYDYPDDAKLLVRLNRVMRRVKLAELPSSFSTFFPDARRSVRQRLSELLAGEQNHKNGETQ